MSPEIEAARIALADQLLTVPNERPEPKLILFHRLKTWGYRESDLEAALADHLLTERVEIDVAVMPPYGGIRLLPPLRKWRKEIDKKAEDSLSQHQSNLEALRAILTAEQLIAFCKLMRAQLGHSNDSRNFEAHNSPEILRGVWAAMRRMGNTVPPAPELLTKEVDVRGFLALPNCKQSTHTHPEEALAAIDASVAWCDLQSRQDWSTKSPNGAETLNSHFRTGTDGVKRKTSGPKGPRNDVGKDRERCEQWEKARAAGSIKTYAEFEKEKGYDPGSTKPMVKRHKEQERNSKNP